MVADRPDPAAVVPAAGDLEHARQPELLDVRRRRHDGVPRARHAQRAEPLAHHRLVLGVDERLRARPYGDAGVGQRVQVLGRHVLVVEGDDLGPAGDLAQHLEVSVVADDRVGDDLRRRDALRLGQQPQRDPERRGRLGQHPRELPATDDGDGGREVGHGANPSDPVRERAADSERSRAGRTQRVTRWSSACLAATTWLRAAATSSSGAPSALRTASSTWRV